MRILIWNNLDANNKASVLTRPQALADENIRGRVADILGAVREQGDAAVRIYTKRFDGVDLTDIKVSVADFKAAWDALPATDKSAMEVAKANIEAFHQAQMPRAFEVETMPGVLCRREPRTIDSAGLYVPGRECTLSFHLNDAGYPSKNSWSPQGYCRHTARQRRARQCKYSCCCLFMRG